MFPCRAVAEAYWTSMIDEVLPAMAREKAFVVSENHCFARIIYDHVVGGKWDEVVPRPAIHNFDDEQLDEAIALAEQIADGSADELAAMNRQSLAWRGKLVKA